MAKSRKKLSTVTAKGRMVGIEAKLSDHVENSVTFLEDWGEYYQSILRAGVKQMLDGASESEISKEFQDSFDIQWAWADSVVTEATQRVTQLKTARANQIKQLESSIKSAIKNVTKRIKALEKKTKKPLAPLDVFFIEKERVGLKSKLERIERQREKLKELESSDSLDIVFGGRKLFNAQHHLESNGYSSHEEWLESWRLARSGNFYATGKGAAVGGNPVAKIKHLAENWFAVTFVVPRFLRSDYGLYVDIAFPVTPKLAGVLVYALSNNKPITVRCFRREGKGNNWYISLTTYDVFVPWISSRGNGAIGIDLNADSVDVSYVKPDGNLGWTESFSLDFQDKSDGQRQAIIWDICADVVALAEKKQCPIVIENLDFSSKKATMREMPRGYSRMLSQFCYDNFRTALQSRCDKGGIQLIQVNPVYSSVIGMVKFMGRYGLNSGTAAAMALARRGLRLSERLPKCLARPEDQTKHPWSGWAKISKSLRDARIPRHKLFAWSNPLEVFPASSERPKGRVGRRKVEKSASLVVDLQAGLRSQGGVTDASEFIQMSLFDSFG